MAQLGGLIMIDPSSDAAKNNFFFGGVDNCKWRKPVVPGDCLVSLTVWRWLCCLQPLNIFLNMLYMLVYSLGKRAC